MGSSKLYQKMIEEIQDYAIIVLDEQGFIRNWNKGAQKIKQYRDHEIIGRHFSIFYLPEDLATKLPYKLLEQARQTGRACHEGWRRRKDGSLFWGSITITAIHDDDDVVVGFCKVTRDLTDRKDAEDRLRMSEERYHQMIAEVQDYAIILLSEQGIIENWNAGAEKIKGYKAEEIIGRHIDIFYTGEDRDSGLPGILLNKARQEGKALHEGWRVRKDGTRFWGTIVITALHNKDNKVIGFTKVTRDLTPQKITEDRLAAYTAELEMQNQELEQFAYVASHDLQEPLRKIQTFSELIQANYDDREFTTTYFDKLERSARRMAELIKSLLTYSRLAKDGSDQQPVDLNVVLQEVMQDYELKLEEKKGIITSNVLPVVSGNYIQLTQLFANLISNALKFSRTNPMISINASLVEKCELPHECNSRAEKFHRIDFEDNGIGFEEQYSKIIFSLFQRLHGRHEYTGTGIGLAICKRIVEAHKGCITATGRPGLGATFTVYLPA